MIKKSIISLSAVAALSTASFAGGDSNIAAQLAAMKKEIASLKSQLSANTASIKKVDKLAKKAKKKANYAKMLANGDNLKFDVDFRTSVDKITYKHTDGTKSTNDGLLTNRLWLDAAYAPSDNVSFYARLSYLKAYGAEIHNTQRANGTSSAVSDFDWVTNENAQGNNNLNVKQAYWLYKNDTFLDSEVSWTASIGRRPATDGLLANFREDQDRQSALAHTVNVEFDGASFKWNLENVTPLTGAWVKLCMGRGITNAKPRFANGIDFSTDETEHGDSNMVGVIFVPYDDGQYSIHTNYATADNLIGYSSNGSGYLQEDGTYGMGTTSSLVFKDFGGMSWMTVAFVADGIGEEISDRLDDTKFFASWAQSETDPNGLNGGMLGETTSQTGNSYWVGVQTPCPINEEAKIGVEWNKGSRYWRSMTYGEDTMIGSKIAARGTATEVYYNTALTKSLSASLRYTNIDYDYTGSNGFFGNASQPIAIDSATNNPVKEATDIRAYIRYRY